MHTQFFNSNKTQSKSSDKLFINIRLFTYFINRNITTTRVTLGDVSTSAGDSRTQNIAVRGTTGSVHVNDNKKTTTNIGFYF
jgi:hypothetical protein